MFSLEQCNRAVMDILVLKFNNAKSGGKPDAVEYAYCDFDGASYDFFNPGGEKTKLMLSVDLPYYNELKSHGADSFLQQEYKGYIQSQPKPGFSVSLVFDLTNLPDDTDKLAEKASLLKRNCFASVFHKYFDLQARMEKGENVDQSRAIIHYRPYETLYIKASTDRVTAIFSTLFKDGNDSVLGKLFLQEFSEARKAGQTAPQVLYRYREPPAELADCRDALVGDNVGYVTFVLLPRHTKPQNRDTTIDLLHIFRDYLHYHIKCSKASLHTRLRAKTADFLKVLNRAKPYTRELRTISGRTFTIDPSLEHQNNKTG
ncbi:hypothetical protein FO519_007767 [Halicephalobus sp. NKZ332]|nr:hypothetical protein FO519_007767 [Halicephalobus sp. NKZ332]